MKIRDFVPPIVAKLAKRARMSRHTIDSFATAQQSCAGGYHADELAQTVLARTKAYRDSLELPNPIETGLVSLGILPAIGFSAREAELNVIDFGGACGAHYFLARRLLAPQTRLRWHVVETAAMVACARALADDSLRFYESIDDARDQLPHVDLMFSSCAIQYTENPYESVRQLLRCNAARIFISRTGLTTSSSEIVLIQESRLNENGPGPSFPGLRDKLIRYPVTFARRDRFEALLSERYDLQLVLREQESAYETTTESINLYGYSGVLKSLSAKVDV